MPRRVEREDELDQQAEWCRTVLRFLKTKGRLRDENVFIAAIDAARARRSMSALRAAAADLTERISRLTAAERDELQTTIGDTYTDEASRHSVIAAVEARGRIENDTEYTMLLSRVEEIYRDPTCAPEVERLNTLLAAYH